MLGKIRKIDLVVFSEHNADVEEKRTKKQGWSVAGPWLRWERKLGGVAQKELERIVHNRRKEERVRRRRTRLWVERKEERESFHNRVVERGERREGVRA